VLILDEPTSGLDPVSSAALKDRIAMERDRGCAVLVTSHVLSELEELAEDVVFLLEGKVHYSGSLNDLRMAHGGVSLERAISAMMQASRSGDDDDVLDAERVLQGAGGPS